jgi:hypothetical protein
LWQNMVWATFWALLRKRIRSHWTRKHLMQILWRQLNKLRPS